VGVAAEIVEHVLGAAEGWLGVDPPVFAKQRSQPGGEEFGLREPRQIPGKMQLASLKGQLLPLCFAALGTGPMQERTVVRQIHLRQVTPVPSGNTYAMSLELISRYIRLRSMRRMV
jgi:hypothetical protein